MSRSNRPCWVCWAERGWGWAPDAGERKGDHTAEWLGSNMGWRASRPPLPRRTNRSCTTCTCQVNSTHLRLDRVGCDVVFAHRAAVIVSEVHGVAVGVHQVSAPRVGDKGLERGGSAGRRDAVQLHENLLRGNGNGGGGGRGEWRRGGVRAWVNSVWLPNVIGRVACVDGMPGAACETRLPCSMCPPGRRGCCCSLRTPGCSETAQTRCCRW